MYTFHHLSITSELVNRKLKYQTPNFAGAATVALNIPSDQHVMLHVTPIPNGVRAYIPP
jgi:hypothetical protein